MKTFNDEQQFLNSIHPDYYKDEFLGLKEGYYAEYDSQRINGNGFTISGAGGVFLSKPPSFGLGVNFMPAYASQIAFTKGVTAFGFYFIVCDRSYKPVSKLINIKGIEESIPSNSFFGVVSDFDLIGEIIKGKETSNQNNLIISFSRIYIGKKL